MFTINPTLACDFYKVSHKDQYPQGTTLVYSNFTPRSSKYAMKLDEVFNDEIVFFGLQYYIKAFLIDNFQQNFFEKPLSVVVEEFKRRCDSSLGEGAVDTKHIEDLWELGYLPIKIKALPEGSLVPVKVPVLTIVNTDPRFFWLTNYLETSMSAELWKMCTSATTAFQYRRLLEKYAEETGAPKDFVLWQGHDFSMRGMSGCMDASQSSAGHLLSFLGTDTIPAIEFLEYYYGAKNTFVGGSVPASEHSVMCISGEDDEKETIRRLIKDVYPSGIVSVVSDSWDFWNVITNTAKELKEEILSRKPNELGMAKVVFRPDSGDPIKILSGYTAYEVVRVEDDKYLDVATGEYLTEAEVKGSVECLWDIFGGSYTEKGYKVLNERVGLIYGDSITLEIAQEVMIRLKNKGFASCNVVFGLGSYTYQYQTRDSYGFAMKATYGVVNGEGRAVAKNPKTDNGTKKSAKGLLRVEIVAGKYVLLDEQTPEQEEQGELEVVFDGGMCGFTSLETIRARVAAHL